MNGINRTNTTTMPGTFPGQDPRGENAAESSTGRTRTRAAGMPEALGPRPRANSGSGERLRRDVTALSPHIRTQTSYTPADLAGRLHANTEREVEHGVAEGARAALDQTLSFYPGRGIKRFFQSNAVIPAAESLAAEHVQRVIVATGFSVDTRADGSPLPETDGPIGTAALVHALHLVGKTPIVVTDSANHGPMKAALSVINPRLAEVGRFEIFDHAQGEASVDAAQRLLRETHADAVVTIELPGRTAAGDRRNMRGVDISPFNGAVDELLIQANERDLLTVSVGDGGNEAGMGNLPGIPNALNGHPMQAAEAARHQVTASVSNLGGEAIAAVLLKAYGKLDQLHTGAQQAEMINQAMAAGAVDGVTRGSVAGEVFPNGTTGVDGFAPEVHAAVLGALREQVDLAPVNSFNVRTPDKPMIIAAFDSSDGGLHAVHVLNALVAERYPHLNIRFVPVLDHAMAPYGPRDQANLTGLVDKGLRTGIKAGVDVNMFACNTASTVLPREQFQPGTPAAAVPYVNLIATTGHAIANSGGAHPLILATQATVDSHAYRDAGAELGATVSELAAPNWASQINGHEIDREETHDAVMADIASIVDQIPAETTSVWLCCTHFPAYQTQIQQRLEATGRGHIEVINPMIKQLDATVAVVEEIFNEPDVVARRSRRRMDLAPTPVVITSATQGRDNVESSINGLLGADVPFVRTHFGDNAQVSLARWHIEDPKADTPLAGHTLTRTMSVPSFVRG